VFPQHRPRVFVNALQHLAQQSLRLVPQQVRRGSERVERVGGRQQNLSSGDACSSGIPVQSFTQFRPSSLNGCQLLPDVQQSRRYASLHVCYAL